MGICQSASTVNEPSAPLPDRKALVAKRLGFGEKQSMDQEYDAAIASFAQIKHGENAFIIDSPGRGRDSVNMESPRPSDFKKKPDGQPTHLLPNSVEDPLSPREEAGLATRRPLRVATDRAFGMTPQKPVTPIERFKTLKTHGSTRSFGDESGLESLIGSSRGLLDLSSQSVLVTIPFFEDLDARSARSLSKLFTRHSFKPGDIVHNPTAFGTPVPQPRTLKGSEPTNTTSTDCFFVIVSGTVEVGIGDPSSSFSPMYQLQSGQWFGEHALIGSDMYSLVVRAETEAEVLSVGREKFTKFCNDNPNMAASVTGFSEGFETSRIVLKSLPLFKHVDELKLQVLAGMLELKQYAPNAEVCRQGEPGDGVHILIKGQCNVYVDGGDELGAHSVVCRRNSVLAMMNNIQPVFLNSIQKGQWFGEICLLQNTPRTATVKAVTTTATLFLSRSRFQAFLRYAPEIRGEEFTSLENNRIGNTIRAIPAILAALPNKEVGPMQKIDQTLTTRLGKLLQIVYKTTGEVIAAEGLPADFVYFLVSGVVQISVEAASNITQTNIIPSVREPDQTSPSISLNSPPSTNQNQPSPSHAAANNVSSRRKATIFSDFTMSYLPVADGEASTRMRKLVEQKNDPKARRVSATAFNRPITVRKITKLKNGDIFGDSALLSSELCSTSLFTSTADTDCVLLALPVENAREFVQELPAFAQTLNVIRNNLITDLVNDVSFLKSAVKENKPWSKVAMLGTIFSLRSYEAGDVIMQQSKQTSESFYIVTRGSVWIRKEHLSSSGMAAPYRKGAANKRYHLFESVFCATTVGTRSLTSIRPTGRILHSGAYFGFTPCDLGACCERAKAFGLQKAASIPLADSVPGPLLSYRRRRKCNDAEADLPQLTSSRRAAEMKAEEEKQHSRSPQTPGAKRHQSMPVTSRILRSHTSCPTDNSKKFDFATPLFADKEREAPQPSERRETRTVSQIKDLQSIDKIYGPSTPRGKLPPIKETKERTASDDDLFGLGVEMVANSACVVLCVSAEQFHKCMEIAPELKLLLVPSILDSMLKASK